MGQIIVTKGSDFVSGDHQNIAVDFEGTARLASLHNLIPDANMEDFEADGQRHRYWKLFEAPRPNHWGVYMRDNKTVTNFSRQTMAPLPLSQSTYQHVDELIRGAGPVDPSNAIDVANPDDPRLSTFTVGQHIGLPAGFITVAFGWIVGPQHWTRSAYYTPPGIRSEPIQIAQGQGVQILMPQTEIPAGVVGIIVYANYPTATIDAARNAQLYPQIRQPAKTFRTMARIVGPFLSRAPADIDVNRSYWGDSLKEPKAYNSASRFKHAKLIQVQLSYTLFTERGTSSKSSAVHPAGVNKVHTAKPGCNRINFHPRSFPVGAVEWEPEVRFYIDGEWSEWYKVTKKGGENSRFRRNEHAPVLVADPEKWPEESNTQLVKLAKKSEIDSTGVAPPEEGLEVPTLVDLNSSGLTPGNHQVRTSYFVNEDEGKVSPAKKLNVVAGQGIRVHKPLFHNRMPNANASELTTNDPDVPNGWVFFKPYPVNLTCRKIKGGVKVVERRNANTGVTNVFSSPFGHLLKNQNRYTVRFRISSDDFSGGSAFVWLDEYNDQEQFLRTTSVARFRGSYNRRVHLRLSRQNADPENINIVAIGTDTALVRVRVDARASSSTGPSNYSYNFTHWGVFEGWGDPREIADDKLGHNRAGNEEPDEYGYPEGGYCVIVENPNDGPVEYDAGLLHREYFENQLDPRWTKRMEGSATLGNFIRPSDNLSGQYALRIRKADTTNTVAVNCLISDFTEASSSLAFATDIYINKYDTTNVPTPRQLYLGSIRAASDRILAQLFWREDTQQLLLRSVTANGIATDIIGTSVELKDTFSVEVHASGGGTVNGRLRVYVGRNKSKRELVVDISSIDWQDRTPTRITLGVESAGDSATREFDLWYDNVVVTLNSTEAYTRQPGNYIEYYGPARTPRNGRYGPEGLRVPVEPNTTYTIGMNVWHRDLELDSDLLRFRSMSPRGTIEQTHGPVVKNLVGDSEWKRVFKTFTTGADASYVEFYGNVLGAGLVKIHGVALEKGTVKREYDGRNQRSGFLVVNLSTELPDVKNPTDPVYYLSHVNRIREAQVIGTEDEETSYAVQYRYGDSLATLSNPVNDWAEISRDAKVVQVRVDLSSTSDFNTPEIEEIQLDLERPVSQLCRGDGTEYRGGVIVRNIGAELPIRNVENVVLANGRLGKSTRGSVPIKWFKNLTIEAHRDSTVTEIVKSYGYGDSEVVLDQSDKRYTLVFEELPEFEVKPKSRMKRGGREDFVVYEATGVNAYIVGKEEEL